MQEGLENGQLTQSKVEKPEKLESFWDIFRILDPETGQKTKFFTRMQRNSQLGAYHARAIQGWVKGLMDRFRSDPDDVFNKADRIGNDYWDQADKDVKEDKLKSDRNPEPEPHVERMSPTGTEVGRARGPRVKVEINPQDTENQVRSNHVGPERQVTTDEGGANRLPKGEKTALRPAPRLLRGPESVGAPGSGAAAADKGATKARQIASARSGQKALPKPVRKPADLEL